MGVEESGAGGPWRDAERLGDLGRGVAQEVMQHEDRPLIGRQPTEPAFELVPIGEGEQVVGGGRSVDRQHPKVHGAATLTRRLADTHVDEESAKRRIEAVRIAEPTQVTPGDHQRVLEGVLGPIDIAEDLEGDPEQPLRARADQVHEGRLVAASCRCHEIAIHPSPLSAPVWRVSGAMVLSGTTSVQSSASTITPLMKDPDEADPQPRSVRDRCVGLVAVVVVVVLRPVVQRAMGVNVDIGSGGLAELVVPDGYEVSVFAEGLASPRFMDVSADGVLFVAERGADRVVALPDRDADGRADETIEVGRGFESAHSVAFEPDGGLLVAGETTLFRLRLGADLREAERSVVLEGLTTGGHSTRTVAVLPDGQLLLSAGSTCNVCVESDPRRAAINLVPPEGGSSRVT